MFEIELTEPKHSTCRCCGGTMTNLTRFVAKDGLPFAIYYATFADNHRENGVLAAIGIDNDWQEIESESRVAFACRLWTNGDDYVTSITDKVDSPWSESKVLGRILDRDEALANELVDEVYHLVDHILVEDIVIREFFEQPVH
jgi:predicted methyltransferase MtxX (methanogen marker protein 4)